MFYFPSNFRRGDIDTKPKRANTEDDNVYELDGLQPGPIYVGSYKPEVGDKTNNQVAINIKEFRSNILLVRGVVQAAGEG